MQKQLPRLRGSFRSPSCPSCGAVVTLGENYRSCQIPHGQTSPFVFGNAVGSRYSTLTAHKRRSPFSSCLRIVREAVAFSSHVCLDLTWYAETRAMAGGLLHCILDMLRCNVESRAFRDVGGKSVLCRRRVWRRLNQDFHQCRYSSLTPDADVHGRSVIGFDVRGLKFLAPRLNEWKTPMRRVACSPVRVPFYPWSIVHTP